MFTSRDRSAERSRDIKIGNSSFENVKQFRYLVTNLTNQNSIQEGNNCKLKSQNACYLSARNLLYSSLLPKNIKIKIRRTTILLLFCMGVKLGKNKKKKTTRFPLFAHSRKCYTCNQALKRTRKDNFNDITECILRNK